MATGKDGYSPYRGVWIICLVILIVPVPLIFAFKFALQGFNDAPIKEINHMAIMFAMIVGTIFDFSLMLTGFLNSLISEFFERLGILFRYLFLTPKNALKMYFEELSYKGAALWIYLFLIAGHTVYTVILISSYISIYLVK